MSGIFGWPGPGPAPPGASGITAISQASDFTGPTAFTPSITAGTPGDLSVTYTQRLGGYIKIGPLYVMWVALIFTPTYTTASGVFAVGSIPFSPSVGNVQAGWVRQISAFTWPAGTTELIVTPGTSIWTVLASGTATASIALPITAFPSGSPATFGAQCVFY